MSLPVDIVNELVKRPELMRAVVEWLRDIFAGRNAEQSAARLGMIAAGKTAIREPYRRKKP